MAENYFTDKNYAPGTVVEFGGSAEVQAVSKENSPAIAGVVSTDPHLMNAGLEGDGVVAVCYAVGFRKVLGLLEKAMY